MNVPAPEFCHPAAYQFFAAQLPQLDTTTGLVQAAIAVSMHELKHVDPGQVVKKLDALVQRVRVRVRGDNPVALLAHLHVVLFEEEGFIGNLQDYYDPDNSYLPCVIQTKRGIPIALTLVYKYVAENLGLTVHGINAPAHFLARVQMGSSWTLVDPFFGGRILTQEEALEQIEQMTGLPLPPAEAPAADTGDTSLDPVFQVATHRDWLARIVRNLRAIFQETGRDQDLGAMIELFRLL